MVECILPREQQMRLNTFTEGGSAGKVEEGERGVDRWVRARSYSRVN